MGGFSSVAARVTVAISNSLTAISDGYYMVSPLKCNDWTCERWMDDLVMMKDGIVRLIFWSCKGCNCEVVF